jgi:DMSO/TMAO reductase YedYZ molybdopterin-dependent catalytic subunit
MTSGFGRKLTRRELLRGSLVVGGTLLVGFDKIRWPEYAQSQEMEPFRGGKKLGVVEFTEEVNVPMGKAFGAGLDGRMYTDLSALTPGNPITPTEMFYIRTRASELLDTQKPWAVQVGGLVERPFALGVAELERMARPMGVHLMECAGKARVEHFGMMSVADWTGAPLSEILEHAKAKPEATRVLISGFDRYTTKSINSVPGASWIFTPDELKSARAFLATGINGDPLPRDHGAPVRLVVPGWYGCACIKWVNEITLVDDSAPVTSQMQEYATRTMQTGMPEFARDYQPAVIDQAAMPIRVEKWLVGEKIKYRIVGILWGGSSLVKALEIRFNPEEDYVPVDYFQHAANDPWSFWSHAWTPRETGTYIIRLRVKDPAVVTRRLDSGYYVRTVEITEI